MFFLCRKYWPIWAGVFIGNFSVYSATRFWTVLHSSGFTPNKCVLFDWLNYWTVPRGDGKPRNKQEMNGDCLRYISPRSRLPERVPRLLSKQDFFSLSFFPLLFRFSACKIFSHVGCLIFCILLKSRMLLVILVLAWTTFGCSNF